MVKLRCTGGSEKWGKEGSVQNNVMRIDGDRRLLTLDPIFFETINRGSRNEGGQKLIPVFDDPHRKGRSSPSAMNITC